MSEKSLDAPLRSLLQNHEDFKEASLKKVEVKAYRPDVKQASVELTRGTSSIQNYSFLLNLSPKGTYNERYIYETLLPALDKFQDEHNVTDKLKTVRYFGWFEHDNQDVTVVENGKGDFELISDKTGLSEMNVRLVAKEYAKLHAVSVAMNESNKEQFEELVKPLEDDFQRFVKTLDADHMFDQLLSDAHGFFKKNKANNYQAKYADFFDALCKKVAVSVAPLVKNEFDGMKVLVHGDFWTNQYQFLLHKNKQAKILGWRRPYLSSPIFDLSYLNFAMAFPRDMKNAHVLLRHYFATFGDHLQLMGVNRDKFEQSHFEHLWMTQSRLGILRAPKILERCEEGRNASNTAQPNDKKCYWEKVQKIVNYAMQKQLFAAHFDNAEMDRYFFSKE